MKTTPLVLCFWFLASSTLWAQGQVYPDPSKSVPGPDQSSGNLEPDQRWIEQIDGSFALPSFKSIVDPNPGLGGDINIGYRFDRNWALLIGSGYYQYSISTAPPAANAQLAYIPLVLILRVTFGDGPIHPYLFGGAGIALNTYNQRAETDFYLAPGLGVLYRIAGDMALFIQSRIDLDYTSQNNLGIPLGNPSVFIPIQAGISFFAF